MSWAEVHKIKEHIDSKEGVNKYFGDIVSANQPKGCKIYDNGDIGLGFNFNYSYSTFLNDAGTTSEATLYSNARYGVRLYPTAVERKSGIRTVEFYFTTAQGTPPATVFCDIIDAKTRKVLQRTSLNPGTHAGWKVFQFANKIVTYGPDDIIDIVVYCNGGDSSNYYRFRSNTATITGMVRLASSNVWSAYYQQTSGLPIFNITFIDVPKSLKNSALEVFEIGKIEKLLSYEREIITPPNTSIKTDLFVGGSEPEISQPLSGILQNILYGTSNRRIARRLQFSEKKLIEKVNLVLSRAGSLGATINVEIQGSSGGNPNGVRVGSVAQWEADELISGNDYFEATFPLNAVLEANQDYFLVIYLTSINPSHLSSTYRIDLGIFATPGISELKSTTKWNYLEYSRRK